MSGGPSYFVQVAESVENYVRGVETLPEERRQQVLEACLDDLAHDPEHFLEHYPLAHESYTFAYEYALIDGGLVYTFRFIADGSDMAMGIVKVIYADHETMPLA